MQPVVFTLTELTGRSKNAGRTMIISGLEVGRRTLIVLSGSVVASALPTMIAFPFIHMWALVTIPPVIIAAVFFLIEARTRQGLQVRRYRAYFDKKQVSEDTFYMCFQPIAEAVGFGRIVQSAEEAGARTTERSAAVFTQSRRQTSGKQPTG
ncbi:hypothetical protein [Curtobacterium sp. MCBD17_040]|uniref:hypothetical protein n=1 Tax=Curtobacterium sp. MCBD17_040 TaxID=2175674 RepID=UPI000DA87044|nr:hypothetical protein [Curtobacterium sp. MCBD17_040]WIB65536.1 hypothetical protein DEI94_19370 [Curtobacterium sp. MCBD17_040]